MIRRINRDFGVPAVLWSFMLAVSVVLVFSRAHAQEIELTERMWDGSVIKERGQSIIPLFEGWFDNGDGTKSLCFGYFNLNTEQDLDIPVGEENHIEGAPSEVMLPTHFEPMPPEYRRKYCVFTAEVPADFSSDERIIWTLTSAGETLQAPGHVMPAYVMDEPASDGRGEVAPTVTMNEGGEQVQGRRGAVSSDVLTVRIGEQLRLPVWIDHPSDSVWVGWAKHSGPGTVSFGTEESMVDINRESDTPEATAQVTFSEPGEYVLLMQSIESAVEDFEFFCCHTNVYYNVSVQE